MSLRPVWAEIDLGAITRNARALTELVAPAALCAVVKAYGYGHGPVRVAEAALNGGATWLGVALVEEGMALRRAGLTERVLVLSEPAPGAWEAVVTARLTPAVYTRSGVAHAANAVAAYGAEPLPVHLKVDTGMHRVGADPEEALLVAKAVAMAPELELEGVWTHFAVADEPHNSFTERQTSQLLDTVKALRDAGIAPGIVHASNSAGAIAHPAARLDLVRCGVALYGLAPDPALEGAVDLHAAMSLKARVSYARRIAAGERVSYGLRYQVDRPTMLATVPIGYADGVPRRLGSVGGEVLVGGKRRRIAGTITMDQLLVDCGDDPVAAGDEVVLLGRQGDEYIDAWEWARLLDTIGYEIVCGIGPRVPRIYRS
jgi:alanine racemase